MHRLSLLFALVACTPPAPQRPAPKTSRGLHADEHLEAAREHARRANELASWPEARRNDVGRFDDPNTGLWYRAWDQAQEERRLAAIHEGQAAQLQVAYDEACANVDPGHIRVSPLQRYGTGGMPTGDGVVVFMGTEAGPPDRLLAEMRCHRAWMMLSEAGMEDCPLDLPNLQIQAHGDKTGISVEIRVQDRTLIPELQRRAARDLEMAAQRRSAL